LENEVRLAETKGPTEMNQTHVHDRDGERLLRDEENRRTLATRRATERAAARRAKRAERWVVRTIVSRVAIPMLPGRRVVAVAAGAVAISRGILSGYRARRDVAVDPRGLRDSGGPETDAPADVRIHVLRHRAMTRRLQGANGEGFWSERPQSAVSGL
jgi:hypothetical protein